MNNSDVVVQEGVKVKNALERDSLLVQKTFNFMKNVVHTSFSNNLQQSIINCNINIGISSTIVRISKDIESNYYQ